MVVIKERKQTEVLGESMVYMEIVIHMEENNIVALNGQ